MTVAVCLASSGLWQGWCSTYARVPHHFHHHCNVVGTEEGGILFWEGDLLGLCLSPGRSAHAGEEVGGLRVDGSPSTLLVFCGCELEEADGWLSIFSWSLFKREDSCGLCHSGDFTTHTLSWLPSPSSSSLMKFATICCRAVFFVLEATLMRLMKSWKGNFWYN